jgi:hypothetical protein
MRPWNNAAELQAAEAVGKAIAHIDPHSSCIDEPGRQTIFFFE